MSRSIVFPLLLLGALACDGDDGDHKLCDEADKVEVFVDNDEDGFGGESAGRVCKPAAQQALVDGDCDDTDPHLSPDADEVCDDVDNDCDGRVDEGLPTEMYFPDADGDGYGYDEIDPILACAPKPGWVTDLTDCDDEDAAINPAAPELCNGGIDDDCDHYADTEDLNIDPAELTDWHPDGDGDGWGDGEISEAACEAPIPGWLTNGDDCDDANTAVSPDGIEVCNGIDDNCDGLLDDADPTIDPLELSDYFLDADLDGFGDPATVVAACQAGPGRVTNGDDCDDTDPIATVVQDWLADGDADGVGAGPVVGNGCNAPAPNTAPVSAGVDCDDADEDRFPGNQEICGDGIDQDCSGTDQSCGPIGSFQIFQGPAWSLDPPVYSCLEACALIFGGVASDYQCSTSGAVVDNQAYYDGWGDSTYCFSPRAEDFKLEQPGNPGYDCGFGGCSYSAYVTDHACSSTNYCWAN